VRALNRLCLPPREKKGRGPYVTPFLHSCGNLGHHRSSPSARCRPRASRWRCARDLRSSPTASVGGTTGAPVLASVTPCTFASAETGFPPAAPSLSRTNVSCLCSPIQSILIRSPKRTCSVASKFAADTQCAVQSHASGARSVIAGCSSSNRKSPRRTRSRETRTAPARFETRCCTCPSSISSTSPVASAAMDEKPQPCPTGHELRLKTPRAASTQFSQPLIIQIRCRLSLAG